MRSMAVKTFMAAVLLAVLALAPASAQSLGQIAPGLTANTLCPLVKSKPNIAINAIASGAARAYDQGTQAQTNFAQAMAAAVMAANANGCINELFEAVNQAIIKGGSKVEYVTGKAIAIGVAKGTASDGGQVLAKATAVVICRGGASATACARAWNQAIKFDPNGCAVLVQAFVQAKAQCAGGKALTSVKAQVWKTPLGFCKMPAAMFGDSNNGGYGFKGSAAGSYSGGQGSVFLSQAPGVTSSSVFVTNGASSAQNGPVVANSFASAGRKLKTVQNWPFSTTANSQATAVNNGVANGPVVANSFANANGGRKLQSADNWPYTTANSAALARNNGIANGGVFANSGANAVGFGQVTANSAAGAVNNGNANGAVAANSNANAAGH